MTDQTLPYDDLHSGLEYFQRQLDTPYRSTSLFFDFLDTLVDISPTSVLVDACCGAGINSFYASSRYKLNSILSFDFQQHYLDIASNLSALQGLDTDTPRSIIFS